MRSIIAGMLILVLVVPVSHSAQMIEAKGTVEAVTLFRGQALVTRVVPVEAPAGAVQLTVPDLPDAVMGDSLFVNSGADLQVRAVRYHTHAVGKAPEKEVQDLDDQIAGIEKQIRENDAMKQLISEKQAYLNKLDIFVAPTAQTEMTKGVLNAETLGVITDMVFDKRTTLAKELLDLNENALKLRQELDLLRRKRAELAKSHSKTIREAIVFLDKTGNEKSQLRLNYLVENASWSPTYNIRGSVNSQKIAVEIGALAQQTSGEDWDSIDLTLSTAGANLVAEGPTLAPLWLHLSATPLQAPGAEDLEKRLRSVKSKLRNEQIAQQREVNQASQRGIQWNMNAVVQEMQQIELATNPDDLRAINRKLGDKESGLAVTYKIEGKVSIASRHDNQMVQIVKLNMPTTFFYEATPLLTEQVYRYAEAVNDSDLSLLQGCASVYMDGEFMGTSTMPMVARGQKVTVGFGIEPQLRAWREFVSMETRDQFLGGKKEVKYKYRLVLDNYSEKPVAVRIFDRIPMRTEAISVELGQLKDPLCKEAHYERAYRPQGILRWDIEIPAKAARESARIIEYGFELKFDENLHVASAPQPEPTQGEKAKFEEMLDLRMYSH